MNQNPWIHQLFKAIDAKDAKTFAAFLAPSCVFRFGNMPPVEGKDNIEIFVNGFFESIASLEHKLLENWDIAEGSACHGQVSYTRKDGSVLTAPFANILKGSEGNITEYLIFADTSELYDY